MELSQFFTQLPQFETVVEDLQPKHRQLVTGLSGSAKTMMIAALFNATKKNILIVTDTLSRCDDIVEDLQNVIDEDDVIEFPVEEVLAAEVATSSPEYKATRVQALADLLGDKPKIVVTSVSGTKRILPSADDFLAANLTIKVEDDIDLDQVRNQLYQMGYVPEKMVAAPGEFSLRGSIIDIYPLNSDYPVRIDLFDTEVDSLRYFDVSNQRSVENIESISILPATDMVLTSDQKNEAIEKLSALLAKRQPQLLDEEQQLRLSNTVEELLSDARQGVITPDWLMYAKLIYDNETTIFDYLDEDGVVLFDDYSRILENNQQLVEEEQAWADDKFEHGEIVANDLYTVDFREHFHKIKQAEILLSLFQKGLGNLKLTQLNDIKVRPMQKFFGQMPLLKTEIDRWHRQDDTVVILVKDKARMQKVTQTLADFEIKATQTNGDEILEHQVQVVNERLKNGFELPVKQLAVITESEMFTTVLKKRARRQTFSNAERIKSYTDLKPGDYVVHANHGIGKYEGMKTMEVDGKHQDYMTIAYQNNAKLFIPVTQLNLIQKYVSSEDKHPRVNKLGGSEWQKTKSKVQGKIEDIADDLIELYAKRSNQQGYAFPEDDEYQEEFEAAFPYQPTPDQVKSSEEIKRDMQQPHPMDRLLVGDVGYGKTEVALHAAFKAIEAGKQVAFLVPTTVLAQQHYETMVNRFEGFPVSVAVLSRFRTKKQVEETKAGLLEGSIDIVVGTHRLLSDDIKFSDLGLLMVDEEQRFGVKHKEKIKQLRSNVDVLTLTATPIPRTLNMSMMGVRDLSVIETPPANRYPIQTYVMEENAGAIREGITREMHRGGQVFFMHNRVSDIEETVMKLQALVPDARISYIHGQMTENQLETILYDFVNGEYDVLVTTTIIETGVDIPNANTLFVEDADHMGLSQLYQIRGRIGRSNRVAYAYFMYKPNKVLTEVSENRLEAIRDFTELGSGFKIAMRDLSLRGAGNLLGKQQSGFVDSVGYDMYTQMLADAVATKRGKRAEQRVDTTVEMDVEAYLPSDYIDDSQQKIELYKRIRQMQNDDQYRELQSDLIDRFGDYPVAVENLLTISRIKMYADASLIEKIRQVPKQIVITLSRIGTEFYDSKQVLKAIAQTNFRSMVGTANDKMQVTLIIQPNMEEQEWLAELTKFVVALDKEHTGNLNNEK
ncbi:MAG: transcription-repair coupling factor [Apilactobacillus sp.]|uniref:transcription-repair coupling factor n=1 Tax=Apilactobacillus sp. TaxID=2767901 RepID=UPI0025E5E31B|nr:transcription-repair coupling factor [Apilactobacillus sp.]MCT6822847.1 transcription-repair coupling factor [Apilactobacillus sp.]MCT6858536.1 transcription-repair coupling factor [Apilactobacillus sp.]